jgi:hypothetical protein
MGSARMYSFGVLLLQMRNANALEFYRLGRWVSLLREGISMKVSLDGVARYWNCADVNYLVVPRIRHGDWLIITSNYIHTYKV